MNDFCVAMFVTDPKDGSHLCEPPTRPAVTLLHWTLCRSSLIFQYCYLLLLLYWISKPICVTFKPLLQYCVHKARTIIDFNCRVRTQGFTQGHYDKENGCWWIGCTLWEFHLVLDHVATYKSNCISRTQMEYMCRRKKLWRYFKEIRMSLNLACQLFLGEKTLLYNC